MNSLVFAALFASAAVAVSANILVSPTPLTNNQAVMYCADLGSRLLDVTSATTASVNQHLAGQVAWIGSWDYNFYNRGCLAYNNGHIGSEDCSALLFAACNPVNLLNPTHVDHNANTHHDHNDQHLAQNEPEDPHPEAHEAHQLLKSTSVYEAKDPIKKEHVKDLTHDNTNETVKEKKSVGPRASRNSRTRHQKDFISSDSSNCSSSGSECAFEYVYLTNTVTQVWTSLASTIITTSTVTNFITIGTVAAYVVTSSSN